MKTFSISQVSVRKQTLASIRSETQFAHLYGSLAPEVFCPQKVRIGTIGDGGKWVCNIWNVPRDTVLLSLGLNNFIGFEEEWQRITSNANILYGVDVDEQSDLTKEKYSKLRGITKKALISETFTIEDLAKEFKIYEVEILKIDIEGAEKTCLIPFLKKYQVCQIYLEVHGGAPEHAKLLREIAHLKYRLFAYEVNGYSMNACEYSFIHESCLEKYGGIRIANYLDF
ncbi:hypothetical protein CAEBREN_03699 [Caenorhabditis brenneri]|uniref:Methyltransferase FkbM domain-containing protein n=1 Tax=Caenorhabditis brenneri TaxID=135651 RepID=G0N6P0_CAEBE|nr:hypothetical protein CAEBREN_03699 [Caenorhabditis brenneri]